MIRLYVNNKNNWISSFTCKHKMLCRRIEYPALRIFYSLKAVLLEDVMDLTTPCLARMLTVMTVTKIRVHARFVNPGTKVNAVS